MASNVAPILIARQDVGQLEPVWSERSALNSFQSSSTHPIFFTKHTH